MTPEHAEQLLQHLRDAQLEPAALFDVLGTVPAVDYVRSFLKPEDKPWIWTLVESGAAECALLGLRLLRPFAAEESTQTRLQELWRSATTRVRIGVLFRLLDAPALSEDWQQTLLSFVIENREEFREACVHFYGSQDIILRHVIERMGDPSFPEDKKWVYFCVVAACLDDNRTAAAFVRMGTLMRSNLIRRACQTLLDRDFI